MQYLGASESFNYGGASTHRYRAEGSGRGTGAPTVAVTPAASTLPTASRGGSRLQWSRGQQRLPISETGDGTVVQGHLHCVHLRNNATESQAWRDAPVCIWLMERECRTFIKVVQYCTDKGLPVPMAGRGAAAAAARGAGSSA